MAGRARVELGEHLLLDLHPLRNRFDDEVDVAERVVGGRALDQAERALDLGGRLLLGDPALLREAGDLALADLASLLQPRVDEPPPAAERGLLQLAGRGAGGVAGAGPIGGGGALSASAQPDETCA